MTVNTDMRTFGDPELEGRALILVSATNVGDRPVTLELLTFAWYDHWWNRIRRKPKNQYLVKNPGRGREFPYILKAGERWDGMAFQQDDTAELAAKGHLMCQLHHASSKRPVRKRIVLSTVAAEPSTKATVG